MLILLRIQDTQGNLGICHHSHCDTANQVGHWGHLDKEKKGTGHLCWTAGEPNNAETHHDRRLLPGCQGCQHYLHGEMEISYLTHLACLWNLHHMGLPDQHLGISFWERWGTSQFALLPFHCQKGPHWGSLLTPSNKHGFSLVALISLNLAQNTLLLMGTMTWHLYTNSLESLSTSKKVHTPYFRVNRVKYCLIFVAFICTVTWFQKDQPCHWQWKVQPLFRVRDVEVEEGAGGAEQQKSWWFGKA